MPSAWAHSLVRGTSLVEHDLHVVSPAQGPQAPNNPYRRHCSMLLSTMSEPLCALARSLPCRSHQHAPPWRRGGPREVFSVPTEGACPRSSVPGAASDLQPQVFQEPCPTAGRKSSARALECFETEKWGSTGLIWSGRGTGCSRREVQRAAVLGGSDWENVLDVQ